MRAYQTNCLNYAIALLDSLNQEAKSQRNAYAAKASQLGASIKEEHKKNIQESVKTQALLIDFLNGRS